MTNGTTTRENILRQAAELFNRQGYAGASISDIMKATGLKKGGIYNHFTSKEQLWLEAFEYADQLVRDYFNEVLERHKDAGDRLLAILEYFRNYVEHPLLSGGCPLLNTAIECDDTNNVLRDRVRIAFDELGGVVERIVDKGLERNQLRPGTDAKQLATVFLCTLEGGVMLSRLYDGPEHMRRAADHLAAYVQTQVLPEGHHKA